MKFGVRAAFLIMVLWHAVAHAQTPLTPGSLVLYRVGNGTTSLSNAAFPISLLEVSTNGTLLQTIAVPTSGSSMLTANGTAITMGKLRVSENGQYVAVPGFAANPGTANVSNSTVSRRVLIYSAATGNLHTTLSFTSGPAAPYSRNDIRGAIPSDSGDAAWTAGFKTGFPVTNSGFYYLTNSTETNLVAGNVTAVDVFGGQLYGAHNTGSPQTAGVRIGTGLPVTGNQTVHNMPGLPTLSANFTSFQLVDVQGLGSLDTLYFANGVFVEKYCMIGGNWSLVNSISAPERIMDLTVEMVGSTANLYFVTANALYSFSDASGFNANMTGSLSGPLLSAGSNYAFRGIDILPVPEPKAAGAVATFAIWLIWGRRGDRCRMGKRMSERPCRGQTSL